VDNKLENILKGMVLAQLNVCLRTCIEVQRNDHRKRKQESRFTGWNSNWSLLNTNNFVATGQKSVAHCQIYVSSDKSPRRCRIKSIGLFRIHVGNVKQCFVVVYITVKKNMYMLTCIY
jgi:hypothetical protein